MQEGDKIVCKETEDIGLIIRRYKNILTVEFTICTFLRDLKLTKLVHIDKVHPFVCEI